MIGFVELGAVKGLEVNDDEGVLKDVVFDVVTNDVGLWVEISGVVLGLLEDSDDTVAVLEADVC